jgi:hypothetical protein
MIEILIEYLFGEDHDIAVTMIHGDIPVVEISYNERCVIERKFIKTDPYYHKFSIYNLPGMKLRKYGWSLSCNHRMLGPVVERNMRWPWRVIIFGIIGGSEHDINFDNFGPVWVEMLEDYHQMKIDVKRLNSQKR